SSQKAALLQGTLDMLVLRALSHGPMHGYGIIHRVRQRSGGMLLVEQGALYPALCQIEQRGRIHSKWEVSGTGRKARFYALTKSGQKQMTVEDERWDRLALAIAKVRQTT